MRNGIPTRVQALGDFRHITDVAKQLGVSVRKATALVMRGPLVGTWWNGVLVVHKADLARYRLRAA